MTVKNQAGVEFEHALWPAARGVGDPVQIPHFELIGTYKVGKTTFAAQMAIPGKHKVLALDHHNGWSNVDMGDHITVVNLAGTGAARWQKAQQTLKGIKPGEYDLVIIDTIGEMREDAAAVCPANRNTKGLFWKAVDDMVDPLLRDAVAKAQTLCLIAHESNKWVEGNQTRTLKPSWGKFVDRLATVALWLVHSDGPAPAAYTYYNRLQVSIPPDENDELGQWKISSILPGRIPAPCTPASIRGYILNAKPWDDLSPEEQRQFTEHTQGDLLTEDDKLLIRARIAELDAQTAGATSTGAGSALLDAADRLVQNAIRGWASGAGKSDAEAVTLITANGYKLVKEDLPKIQALFK